MPATLPTRYALGRNSTFTIQYPANTGQTISICVSEGSINLTTDIIEIPNNCNGGWKIKLAGNKAGTVNVTGYLASGATAVAGGNLQPFTWIGEIVSFECEAFDGQSPTAAQALYFAADGVMQSCNVTIDANDALRCEMVIEMSGAPVGYAGLANSAGL
jgi:hypothetical protein